ncbi:MMPL family transporter [Streptomyces sp. NPDC058221]|uniref:MMPL family transporter n=1 Tax=Streptomyces sp. NPDC058221 TaxID=3346388 RepID=UPI0036E57B7F
MGPAAVWAVACMAVLLLLFTRSVLIPVKAIVVGALSLGASSGVVVLVFQDGLLAALVGMDSRTGPVDACMLLLALCLAFALSMDYEMFLLSRIQEEHLLGAGNRAAVAKGVEQTGRLVTTAALALAVSVGALITSSVALLKVLGFALALAVLVDATVVRAVLVPASMCLAGRANWWAPAPVQRMLNRLDLHGHGHRSGHGAAVPADESMEPDRLPGPAKRGKPVRAGKR